MTLADFARQNGIDPATARQWKRRGRIVERDGGFALADRRSVTDEEFEKMRFPVTPDRDSVTVESVTERDVTVPECDSVTDSVIRETAQWLRDLGEVQQTEIDGLRLEIDAMNERLRRLEAQLFITGAPTVKVRSDWGA